MTKTQLMRHAVKLWQVPHVPRAINRANARKWVAAVERLGDKWLLSKPVERKEQ
jgi:hypothetical protein